MATTSPDSIYFPSATDQIAPLETVFATMASSVQAALSNTRAKFNYRWSNAAARNAQTGMRIDDEGYQVDTGVTYRYDGSSWQLWKVARKAYTPVQASGSSFSLGTLGGIDAFVGVRDSFCRIDFRMRAAGTGISWGDVAFTVPYAPTGNFAASPGFQGTAYLNDSDGGAYLGGVGLTGNGLWRVYRMGSSNGASATLNSSQPFTIGVNDTITGFLEYPV